MKKIAIAALAAITLSAQPAQATEWNCPQWRQLALDVGFSKRDWVTLDKILYRESRCRPEARGLNKKPDGTVWSTCAPQKPYMTIPSQKVIRRGTSGESVVVSTEDNVVHSNNWMEEQCQK